MKKCIVTGATGFIGTALCRELLRGGDEVFAVVRPKSARRHKLTDLQKVDSAAKTRLHVVEADLGRLGGALSEAQTRADVFFHLAWNGSAGAEREDFDIQQKNIAYTAEAIRAAKACGCTKFVGAGSQAEYGVVHGVASEDKTVSASLYDVWRGETCGISDGTPFSSAVRNRLRLAENLQRVWRRRKFRYVDFVFNRDIKKRRNAAAFAL